MNPPSPQPPGWTAPHCLCLKEVDGAESAARADRPFKGIALILASTVFFGCSDVTAKYLAASLPSIEITWIRFLTFALIMTPAMIPGSPLFALHDQSGAPCISCAAPPCSAHRCSSSRAGVPADRRSIRHRLHRAAVRHRACDFFLGEKVGLRRWIAAAVGLVGVLIILRPGTGAFHPAAFFPLVSALAWACTLIMTRMMSGTERAITAMAYSSIAGVGILCCWCRSSG